MQALKAIGIEPMDLHAAGAGVEDLLLPLRRWGEPFWLLCEVKVARNKRGEVTPSQYTRAQREWRERTAGWPRITVTGPQDAVDQVRALTG